MLKTISDFSDPAFRGAVRYKWLIAPAARGKAMGGLMADADEYAPAWVTAWHKNQPTPQLHDVACYFLENALISGDGQIWLDDKLLTARPIMPAYVAGIWRVDEGGTDFLKENREQPVRTISAPCLVATGHGTQVYGHFLIEVLFRLLCAKAAVADGMRRYKVLVEKEAPAWYVDLIVKHLGVDAGAVEVFDRGHECVLLQNAIVPSRVLQEDAFHPVAVELLDELIARLKRRAKIKPPRRVFITRNGYVNHSAPHRICTNEAELAKIAAARFGFEPIAIETLSWPDQIALFRGAEIVAGQAGSGLHNALFSAPGSRLGSIGFMNLVQGQIAALRDQTIGYLAKDIDLEGEFAVDEERFAAFMAALCA